MCLCVICQHLLNFGDVLKLVWGETQNLLGLINCYKSALHSEALFGNYLSSDVLVFFRKGFVVLFLQVVTHFWQSLILSEGSDVAYLLCVLDFLRIFQHVFVFIVWDWHRYVVFILIVHFQLGPFELRLLSEVKFWPVGEGGFTLFDAPWFRRLRGRSTVTVFARRSTTWAKFLVGAARITAIWTGFVFLNFCGTFIRKTR